VSVKATVSGDVPVTGVALNAATGAVAATEMVLLVLVLPPLPVTVSVMV
jgi:hypothetical protein